jgi:hypothetical protein
LAAAEQLAGGTVKCAVPVFQAGIGLVRPEEHGQPPERCGEPQQFP